MGSDVSVSCQCGLKRSVYIGSGMADFTSNCSFPCHCKRCQDVVQGNLLAEALVCPNCGGAGITPYDDPGLVGAPGGGIVAEWYLPGLLGRRLVLTDETYVCPKCKRKTLLFQDSGTLAD